MTRLHDASAGQPAAAASRFSELAAALALDAQSPADAKGTCGLDAEAIVGLRRELAAVELPPLELGARRPAMRGWRHSPVLWLAASLALIAAASVFTTLRSVEPRWQVKGATSVRVYWERAGRVRELASDMPLVNGDRVMVDVLASEAATAYWAVFDRSGALLGGWDGLERSAVRLEPGQRRTSSTSLRLVGVDEGERAVVFVCPAAAPLTEARFAGLEAQLRPAVASGAGDLELAACRVRVFSLR
jgi:hypothetical protein